MAILKNVWKAFDLSEIAADRSSYASTDRVLLRVTRETGNSVFVAEKVAKPDKIDVRLTGETIRDFNALDGPIERLWKKGCPFCLLVRNGSDDLAVVWKRESKKEL
ncbi:MAG: hypothetical protein WC528_01280 [Patescibacteria group bacterium]